ncbi:MAG: chemotaxis response regulator protein-glutamate methylesterase [Proteobacteria bacterium]|nr:chemotaxis response regulator protein-glutamate methylesterase [Pseudomonadota bacterium]
MSIGADATKTAASGPSPVRVMVVDDSAVIRGLITRALEVDPGIQVVATVSNGQLAVSQMSRSDVDVIVLDIEMPVMDGLTALPELLKAAPDVKIIMASTLTQRNAQVSIEALQKGASDYIPKPSSTGEIHGSADFKRDLIEKVKALGKTRRDRRDRNKAAGIPEAKPAPAARAISVPGTRSSLLSPSAPVVLRPFARSNPQIVGIGSSTGGPQALFTVLGNLPASFRLPIVITQHMPATFTTILAEHIARVAKRPSAEGRDGEPIEPGKIYLAPGDNHMVVETQGTQKIIRLNKNPPENFCRPAVDPMFRSLAAAYGPSVLGVVLTGMGSDGAKGGRVLVDAGANVIAQDEASSVVWGMPGAAANAGICSALLPIDKVAGEIARIAGVRP